MNITKLLILIVLIGVTSMHIQAQSFFKGSLIAGANASQIDGDRLAGYKKFGITTGLKVEFPISASFDLGIEFLFSQRGSRSAIVPNQFSDQQRIHLNYASLPIVVKWNDWWIEEESYYKFNLHGGVAPARLISSKSNFSSTVVSGEFKNYDFSLFLGAAYSINKKWAIALRYTRSLNPLYTQKTASTGEISALIGYFITFRTEYTF